MVTDAGGEEVNVSDLQTGGLYLNGNSTDLNTYLSHVTGKENPKV